MEQTVSEYASEVSRRIEGLSKEDSQALSGLYGTQGLVVISKVLGPEVSSAVADAMNTLASNAVRIEETSRGLGSRR